MPIALRYSGETFLNASPERVERVLSQIDELVKCLPGYKRHEVIGERRVKVVVEAAVGPVSGDVNVIADVKLERGEVVVRGECSGLLSKMDFVLKLKVEGRGNGALLKWSFEGAIEGLAAKFDKRLVDHIVRTWINRMGEEFGKKLTL